MLKNEIIDMLQRCATKASRPLKSKEDLEKDQAMVDKLAIVFKSPQVKLQNLYLLDADLFFAALEEERESNDLIPSKELEALGARTINADEIKGMFHS